MPMKHPPDLNEYATAEHALRVLALADRIPHRTLYAEIIAALAPGGVFCNLEHVAPPTAGLHARFLRRLGITAADEDPSNKLLDVETQLRWLREIGFQSVDCHWKWLEPGLLGGTKL